MTLLFFGSDLWFSQPVLSTLLKAGHDVPIVVTKRQGLRPSALRSSTLRLRPNRLRLEEAKGQGKSIVIQAKIPDDISRHRLETLFHQSPITNHQSPAAIILAAFGPPFLPSDLLDWPTYGCLNVHASLLPRWRGASPVCAAIAAGDAETGVTIIKMTKEIDRGPILGQASTEIYQPSFKRSDPASSQGRTFSDFDTRESLTRRLGVLGGELIVDVLGQIGQIRPIGQSQHSPTPYTYRLKKEDGCIDWTLHPEETRPERSRRIERFIRAVTPWPGAWTEVQAQRQATSDKRQALKILKAHLEPLPINPLTHQLILDEVQLPGKNPITWKQFLAGHPGAQLN